MNKILKILSILIIGFVMFSCSTPTNDPETPAPNPEVQTYSITFTTANPNHKIITDYLNSLPEFKNLKEGTEVERPTITYALSDEEYVLEEPEAELHLTYCEYNIYYEGNVTSVVVGNEDIKIKFWCDK